MSTFFTPSSAAPALAAQRNIEGLLFTFYYNNAMELKYLTQRGGSPPEDHFVVVGGQHIIGRSSPIACTTAFDGLIRLYFVNREGQLQELYRSAENIWLEGDLSARKYEVWASSGLSALGTRDLPSGSCNTLEVYFCENTNNGIVVFRAFQRDGKWDKEPLRG
ncbi:hypothetical protein F5Y19DRAFT_445244 [Xylariaceae sp. FL1651]|nr:hypothetical protein F5Y19DRAFT_445244 [Xylariaceae sp. FL1651]